MILSEKLQQQAQLIKKKIPVGLQPRIGLVLGSGWNVYADTLHDLVKIPFSELGWPSSHVVGHENFLCYGKISQDGPAVLVMQGRIHSYEGHDLSTVVFPLQTMIFMGCQAVILTNAAGSLDPRIGPGELSLITDHINFASKSPLFGPNDPKIGTRFPDMSEVYDSSFRLLAKQAALDVGISLHEGVYAFMRGPQYETPAEIKMLSMLGAHLVGMSTVSEAIAARHMGAKVLGISCISNFASGISNHPLTHDEVLIASQEAQKKYIPLLKALLHSMTL